MLCVREGVGSQFLFFALDQPSHPSVCMAKIFCHGGGGGVCVWGRRHPFVFVFFSRGLLLRPVTTRAVLCMEEAFLSARFVVLNAGLFGDRRDHRRDHRRRRALCFFFSNGFGPECFWGALLSHPFSIMSLCAARVTTSFAISSSIPLDLYR